MPRVVFILPLILGLILIPALTAENDTLGPLARKFMETGSPAAREALIRFAGQPDAGAGSAALARLVLGLGDYQEKRFFAAAEELALAAPQLTDLADYAVYYQGLALAAIANHAEAARVLAGFDGRFPLSPLPAVSQRAESLSLSGGAREALELLLGAPRSTAPALLLLAQVAERAGETVRAAQIYQRVYYEFSNSTEQAQALTSINALRVRLGAKYPEAGPAMRLGRADKLAEAKKYQAARAEYRALSLRLKGLLREQAAVRISECDYNLHADTRAYRALKVLKVTQPEAAAERLYYLAACARRLKRQQEFVDLADQLSRQYRTSSWCEEALFAAGNFFLVENTSEKYVQYYRTLFETFPKGRYSALAHWKVAWRAYVEKKEDARKLFEDHIRLYPSSPHLTAAIYWSGRLAEAASAPGSARVWYEYLVSCCPNYYYSLLARDRLQKVASATGPGPDWIVRLLAAIPPTAAPPPLEAPPEWTASLERTRLLTRLGLADLAQRELRYRAETPRFGYLAGLELAQQAAERGNHQQAIRCLKRYTPTYLAYPLDKMPRHYWELLFPLPWRDEIEGYSKLHELDPYLVAALIRQESEFNPGAISRKSARGLMQIMPSTGRLLSRNLGMSPVSTNRLYVPETSLKLGTLQLRRVLDQYQGRLEPALAGYNAGEHRADKWLGWHSMTDPAEFVESIPFSETRGYVQAVLRNAEIYRRLYRG